MLLVHRTGSNCHLQLPPNSFITFLVIEIKKIGHVSRRRNSQTCQRKQVSLNKIATCLQQVFSVPFKLKQIKDNYQPILELELFIVLHPVNIFSPCIW